jgi:glutathione S-transferase
VGRATGRPAFKKAHADQLADFTAGDKARGGAG